MSLFTRSLPEIDVRAENLNGHDSGDADFHLHLMSLPGLFRNHLDQFPESGHFLHADKTRVEKWKNRLEALGIGPKIGLCWRSFNPSWRKRPFSSDLGDLEPILRRTGAVFVNLQGDECAEEIEAVNRRFGCSIHSFEDLDLKNNAEETAALLAALDMVVSCRCWITAFCGALGTPTFCYSAPFNIVMMDLDYDPWAPTTRVFYRKYDEDWGLCMRAISVALADQFG